MQPNSKVMEFVKWKIERREQEMRIELDTTTNLVQAKKKKRLQWQPEKKHNKISVAGKKNQDQQKQIPAKTT